MLKGLIGSNHLWWERTQRDISVEEVTSTRARASAPNQTPQPGAPEPERKSHIISSYKFQWRFYLPWWEGGQLSWRASVQNFNYGLAEWWQFRVIWSHKRRNWVMWLWEEEASVPVMGLSPHHQKTQSFLGQASPSIEHQPRKWHSRHCHAGITPGGQLSGRFLPCQRYNPH